MNYSKKFRAVLALFVVCTGMIFAQSSDSSVNQNQSQNQNLTQSQIEESNFTFQDMEDATVEQKPVSGFWAFVRMIIVLAIVIAAIYFVFKLFKKSISPAAENDPFLRKVSGITLSPGKSIQVVTLIDKAYLVGVSDSSVNLIAEIDDKELINAMNLHSDKTTNQFKAKSFAEVLEMFMPSQKKTEEAQGKKIGKSEGIFDSTTSSLIDALKNRKINTGDEQ